VGVVGDVRYGGLAGAIAPAVYYPFAQDPFPGMYMFVRAAGDPLAALPAVRRAVLDTDPELPVARVQSLEALMGSSIAARRFTTVLLGTFAAVAFALAAVGVYGVVAYGAAQRTREIGLRVALGARPSDVTRLVVWQGLRPSLVGVVLGLAGSVALSRALRGLLYGTSPRDPATYAGVAAALVAVASLAAYVPGRRAAAADPAAALRSD